MNSSMEIDNLDTFVAKTCYSDRSFRMCKAIDASWHRTCMHHVPLPGSAGPQRPWRTAGQHAQSYDWSCSASWPDRNHRTGLIIRSNGNAAAWRSHADDNTMSASYGCVLHESREPNRLLRYTQMTPSSAHRIREVFTFSRFQNSPPRPPTHRGALGPRGAPPGSAPMRYLRTHAVHGMAGRQGRRQIGGRGTPRLGLRVFHVFTFSRVEFWVNVSRLFPPAIDRPTEEP